MVIEIVTFRLVPGADEAAFLATDASVQTDVVYQRRGIVRRTAARGPAGEWLVLTFWDSETDADEAAAAMRADPVGRAYLELIDETSVSTRRYQTLD